MALQQNLIVDQGALFEWDFLVRNDQTTIFDLTGYGVRGQVRKTYDTSTVLLTPYFDISQALGKISMVIYPADTTAISFAGEELECVYDIEMFNTPTGDVKRLVEGTITLKKEVTR